VVVKKQLSQYRLYQIIISVDSLNNDFVFNKYENPDFSLTPNIDIM